MYRCPECKTKLFITVTCQAQYRILVPENNEDIGPFELLREFHRLPPKGSRFPLAISYSNDETWERLTLFLDEYEESFYCPKCQKIITGDACGQKE